MNGHALLVIVVVCALGLGGALLVGTMTAVRAVRNRRAQRAEAAARLAASEITGVLTLAQTIEGLATEVIRAGVEVGKQGFGPVLAGSLRSLADLAEADRPALHRVLGPDGTVTLMFSDIEGSTKLNETLGDEGWLNVLREHDTIVRRQVRIHRGQVVKTLGDSFMVAFRDVPVALACSIAIQRAVTQAHLAGDNAMRVRIGLHTGEVTKKGRDFLGLNVAIAARVAAEAQGGEILVSSATKELAGARHDATFEKRRTVQLKGISGAETVYPVRWR